MVDHVDDNGDDNDNDDDNDDDDDDDEKAVTRFWRSLPNRSSSSSRAGSQPRCISSSGSAADQNTFDRNVFVFLCIAIVYHCISISSSSSAADQNTCDRHVFVFLCIVIVYHFICISSSGSGTDQSRFVI